MPRKSRAQRARSRNLVAAREASGRRPKNSPLWKPQHTDSDNDKLIRISSQALTASERSSSAESIEVVVAIEVSSCNESEDPYTGTENKVEPEQCRLVLEEAYPLTVEAAKRERQPKPEAERKGPKKYLGNSKMTLYRRKKEKEALQSQGFLGVFEFLALKETQARVAASGGAAPATTRCVSFL